MVNKQHVDEKEDFYPIIGRFKTTAFELPTSLDGENVINLQYGVLPECLENFYNTFKSYN